ncbi:MAG TPA: argininosuccinate lyase [Bryobacteraceae bacterium]|nr:argininosuccinate lyase [Bryobacteraceae bacterium]
MADAAAATDFPAPVYSETVLDPNFEQAKKHFFGFLLRIHDAHTRMLARQGIITPEEERRLIATLGGLEKASIASSGRGAREDLFYVVEAALEQACGRELAGKMHTARSRNDIAVTLFRMLARERLLEVFEAAGQLRAALLRLAGEHADTVMPAHTHMQPAQPTTLAHYLLAACEFLDRDAERMKGAFSRVNLSPMGAAAITTSGFPVDREYTARLLGFEGLAENSYGAIAAIDYLTEIAAAIAVAMVNVGKLNQDFLLWSTREFGFLRLSDGFAQGSSIMPQKRNPVALEHTRILASRALGQAQAVLGCAHNTPFGDINDSEDPLQPVALAMFGSARGALRLLAGAIAAAEVDRDHLARRAASDFLTATELADTLVRREGWCFREAHDVVAEAVRACGSDDRPEAVAAALLRIKPAVRLSRAEIVEALDPRHFVGIRKVVGGPAPECTREAVRRAAETQRRQEAWLAQKRQLVKGVRGESRSAFASHPEP